jgi:hypothetical protein
MEQRCYGVRCFPDIQFFDVWLDRAAGNILDGLLSLSHVGAVGVFRLFAALIGLFRTIGLVG